MGNGEHFEESWEMGKREQTAWMESSGTTLGFCFFTCSARMVAHRAWCMVSVQQLAPSLWPQPPGNNTLTVVSPQGKLASFQAILCDVLWQEPFPGRPGQGQQVVCACAEWLPNFPSCFPSIIHYRKGQDSSPLQHI